MTAYASVLTKPKANVEVTLVKDGDDFILKRVDLVELPPQ